MSVNEAALAHGAPARALSLGTRLKRVLVPYAYLSPTVLLLLVLMVVPIVIVFGYSLQDAVITTKQSHYVGLENYVDVLTSDKFRTALGNTVVFVVVSVVAHMLIGLGFALLLNSDVLSSAAKTVFRTIFVLPWLLTVAIIAILWRLLLNPNSVVNAVLSALSLVTDQHE